MHTPSHMNRDPKAPGMKAGSGLKKKPVAGRLKQKAMKAASGMR